MISDQFIITEDCTVCPALMEAVDIIAEMTEALEHGTWTMRTIVRARRFLNRARH